MEDLDVITLTNVKKDEKVYLACGSEGKGVYLWDILTRSIFFSAGKEQELSIISIILLEVLTKQILVCGSKDKSIYVYDMKRKQEVCKMLIHTKPIYSLKGLKKDDRDFLVSGSDEGTLVLWDLGRKMPSSILDESKKRVSTVTIYESNNKSYLVRAGNGISLWDI